VTFNGAPYVHSTNVSPGMFLAPFKPGDRNHLLVLLVSAANTVELRELDPTSGVLTDPQIALDSPAVPTSRPSGVFVPDGNSALGGRIYVAYAAGDVSANHDGSQRAIWQLWSDSESQQLALGFGSYFDNEWLYGNGIDLWYDAGVDTNLRAAWSYSTQWGADPNGVVRSGLIAFRPKADGIEDFLLRNYDDWQVLRYGICYEVTATPGGNNPVTCPPSYCAVDGIKNGNETDVDCGGPSCVACATGRGCAVDADCATGLCNPSTRICVSDLCSDGRRDGNETDVDCGGGTCGPCPINDNCAANSDCVTNYCTPEHVCANKGCPAGEHSCGPGMCWPNGRPCP
jgi:hypothetical protein